ncbi:MAG TPA: hypothetical protein VIK01_14225 [Polyangiaceae bacterium]
MGFDIDDLRRRGFGGFVPLARPEPQVLPTGSGVYVVLREREGEPKFLECWRESAPWRIASRRYLHLLCAKLITAWAGRPKSCATRERARR